MNQSADRFVSSSDPEWRDPDVDPPPPGAQVFLLTEGGVLVRGPYVKDAGYLAWYPFFKKPEWLKQKLDAAFFRNSPLKEELLNPTRVTP